MFGVKRCVLRLNAQARMSSRFMSMQQTQAGAIFEVLKVAGSIERDFTTKLTNKELYAQAMWHLVESKRFPLLAKAFEATPPQDPVHSVAASHAAMLVSGEELKPWRTKEIMDNIPPNKQRSSTIAFALHSYAKSDRLGSAERLLLAYLDRYVVHHPGDSLTLQLLEQLKSSHITDQKARNVESVVLGEKIGIKVLPLSGWVSMLIIYGKRSAWQQCLQILTYLEEMRRTTDAYACEASANVVIEHLDELQHPTYVVSSDYCRVLSERALLLADNSRLNSQVLNSNQVTALQWNVMYHLTLRALCQSNQFPKALEVLQHMRAHTSLGIDNSCTSNTGNGSAEHNVHCSADCVAVPQLPAAISLLLALNSPIAPLQHPLHGSNSVGGNTGAGALSAAAQLAAAAASLSASKIVPGSMPLPVNPSAADPVHGRILQRQQIAAGLRHDITRVVTSLATPVQHKPVGRAAVGKDSRTHSGSTQVVSATAQVGSVANTLAREYVILLCKLELENEAKLFISDVMNHIQSVKYHHRPAPQAGEQESSTKASDKNKEPIVDVRGFSNDSWVGPYLHHLRERGEYAEVDALYTQLLDAADYEDSVRRANPDANRGFNQYRYGPGSVKPTKVKLPVRGRRTTMFHDTAYSYRKAGELGKLTDHMLKHKI